MAQPPKGASTAPVPSASDQTSCLKPGLRMSLRDRSDIYRPFGRVASKSQDVRMEGSALGRSSPYPGSRT